MKKKALFFEKLTILKHETTLLNVKINNITSNLWKIRQVEVTLWLAAVGVGSGAILANNQSNITILLLSVLIPIWFFIADARYNVWYRRFRLREIEIQRFLSSREYFLPASKSKISFDDCLKNRSITFPIFDMSGEQTFGENGDFKWKKSLFKSYCDPIPLSFYGTQIFASVLFSSLELRKQGSISTWWMLPVISLIIILLIYVYSQVRKRIWKKQS